MVIKVKVVFRFLFLSAIALLFAIAVFAKPYSNNSNNHKKPNWPDNTAMMVSVSSDGNYAVTSNLNQQLVLWNMKNKTHKIIATNANIYSAYFIKNTHDFMWQNDYTNEVNVANINGNIVKSFNPGFPTYGQVMTSDLQHYFASDEKWELFSIYQNTKNLIKKGWVGFFGYEKLLNLVLANDNTLLLTSGSASDWDKIKLKVVTNEQDINSDSVAQISYLNGVATWDIATGKPLRKFPGDVNKTFATLSPNGKYIVSGDEADNGFVWYTKTGKLKFDLDSMKYGKWIKTGPGDKDYRWDKTGLIPLPKDFHDQMNMYNEAVLALKFIDNTHYLRFTTGIPYVIVYSIVSPRPLKYIKIAGPIKTADLTKERYPAVAEYVRDQAIDTAPKAHILVMGQQKGNGIIVFKYDPKTMTLKKIWVGNFCGPRSGNPKCW